MNTERLTYLQDVVFPHVETMPTVRRWNSGELKDDTAVLDFGSYIDNARANGKPVSKKYDCGVRGCLAGWYRMLAQEDDRIGEDDLNGFVLTELAEHFGIAYDDAAALFAGMGGGIEGEINTIDRDNDGTKVTLAARKIYLEDLLAQA